MAKKRGLKRKGNKDDQKLSRKEVKFLEDFGHEHPIKDKIDLEDRCTKRVFDEDPDPGQNGVNQPEIEQIQEEQMEPDYYEELLNTFGRKQDTGAESSPDESDEETDKPEPKLVDSESDDDGVDEEEANRSDSENDEEECQPQNGPDNFAKHFFTDFESGDIEKLKSSKQTVESFRWPHVGSFVESRTELEQFHFVKLDKPAKSLNQLQLKPMIKENIPKTMMEISQKRHQTLTPFQLELLTLLTSYKNLLFPERTFENAEEIRVAYSAHALNHILKIRSRVLLHNSQINVLQQTEKILDKEEFRDQGLTRPKVLIVLPFRDSAYKTVNCMISLLLGDSKDSGEKKTHLMNYKRFKKEFGPEEDEPINSRRPEDYKKLFTGNIDDSFRVGISLTKKSFKLYADFYSSDIIIASPLGLRMIIGAPGEEKRDFDFLSSLEIVLMDQTDVFLMQNWEHILHLMDHIHLKPKETHGTDFSRVKLWVLELWSRYYYQLVIFSSVSSSLINGFFNRYSTNFAGKILFRNEIPKNRAAINHVYIQCPQIFQRFECPTFSENSNRRFEFFIKKILPKFRDPMMVRTMIYIPSYFDFVRLRNYFRKEDLSFSQICEYTKSGKVAKARHIFFYGGRHFLLFTERFHFYHRYTIKGIRHLIFYEPPVYPNFYSEMINAMNRANQGKKMATDYSSMSVTVLFNKFDVHSLLGLVGTDATSSLLNSENDMHVFITENVISS